jgi:alpha-tubulin suppressor-like RCC1 family protein
MWGDNTNGLLGDNNTPSYFSWSKISSGGLHTVAIRSDGLLFAWGRNTEGQLGVSDTVHRSSPVQISTNTTSWNSVGAGVSHTIAIRGDGTLWTWGGNKYGQLGDSTTVNRSAPTQIGGLTTWTTSVAGGNHSSAINSTGQLFLWGNNNSGQLAQNYVLNSKSSPVQVRATNNLVINSVVFNGTTDSLLAPASSAFYFPGDFTLEGWAYFTNIAVANPQIIVSLPRSNLNFDLRWFTTRWQISLNGATGTDIGTTPAPVNNTWLHIACVRSSGSIRVYVNGIATGTTISNSSILGYYDQGLGIGGNGATPTTVNPFAGNLSNIRIVKGVAVYSGTNTVTANFTVPTSPLSRIQSSSTNIAALSGTETSLLACQNTAFVDNSINSFAITTTGAPSISQTLIPFTPTTDPSWIAVSAGKTHVVALKNDYTIWSWGDNTYSELGDGTTINRSSPVQIGTSSWSQISAGGTHTAAIKTDSSLYTWGLNSSGQLGLNNTYSGSYWTQISEGPVHTLAIRNDGALFAWGQNDQGQLGLSDTTNRSSPTQIGTSSWTSIDTGDSHSVAIRSDGKLFAWGSNLFGQLGNNPTPINVTWSKISVCAFSSHVVAIKSNGTLWAWGANAQGQLGDSTVVLKSSPVQIGTLTTWIDVAAGLQHSLGILNNNVLYAWGYNANGQLGDLTVLTRSSPIVVGYNFKKVFAGDSISAALDINNYLYMWGYNVNGAVGDYTNISRSSPIQIGNSSWSMVSISNHVLALKPDNTLYTWGLNTNGQLGLGDSTVSRSSPTQIGTSSWSAVSAGGTHSVAIRSDNSLFTWGSNLYGQLGLSDVADRNSPVQVGTVTPSNVYSVLFPGGTGTALRYLNTSINITQSTPWTVEAWVNPNVYPIQGSYDPITNPTGNQYSNPIWNVSQVNSDTRQFLFIDYLGNLVFKEGTTNNNITIVGTITVPLYTWSHVALCYDGANTFTLYVNGVIAGSGSGTVTSQAFQDGSSYGYIGYYYGQISGISATTTTFDGYISNFRYVSGVKVYSGTYFTVPTSILTTTQGASTNISAITGTQTVLLTCQNNSAKDNSSFNRTIASIGPGTITYSALIPFTTLATAVGTNWLSIATGVSNTMAINSLGNLYGWGYNQIGSLGLGDTLNRSSPTQVGTSTWSTVYAGTSFGIAIRSDNSIFAWGGQTFGQLSDYTVISRSSPVQIGTTTANTSSPVQIGTSSWSQVSAGGSHTLGIGVDGILYGWGRNIEGQLGGAANTLGTIWNKVVIGQSHALGIRSDGKLYAWGSNATGQLGDGTIVAKSSPVLIDSGTWSDIAISQGSTLFYSMGIKSDGRLYAWGNNSVGQLGWLSWRQISVGSGHTLLLRSDGQLYAWGTNTQGQLGVNDTANRSSPVQVGTSKWSSISAGTSVSAAIRSDSTLFTWGYNNNGAVGDGSTTSRSSPVQIASASWSQLSVKDYIMATNTQGSLFAWGNNNNGQLGIGTTLNRKAPQLLDGTPISYGVAFDGVGDYLSITSNAVFGFGTNNFTVEYWVFAASWASLPTVVDLRSASNGLQWSDNFSATGAPGMYYNSLQQLTSTITISLSTWAHVAYTRISGTIKIYVNGIQGATGSSSFDLQSSGICRIGTNITNANYFSGFVSNVRIVKGLGVYTGNFIVPTSALSTTQTTAGVNISDITGTQTVLLTCRNNTIIDNSSSTFTITQNGTPITTVMNPFGVTTTSSTSWTQIAAGTASLAIKNTGSLFTWGQNNYGQLGSNTTTNRSSPVQVGSGSWIAISSSNTGHSLAVDSTYTLYAWGNNSQGELGSANEYINVSSPVQVLVGYSTTAISAGNNASIAVTTNNNINTVYAWGLNQADQLNNINAFTWQRVNQGAGIQSSVGSTVGKLYVWGDNSYGQQGVGDTVTRSSPVQVGGFTGSATNRLVVTTPLNTAYITVDNSLYMMGDNTYGQLGQSDTISRSSPVLVGIINAGNWSTVAISGTGHVIAITNNGTLFAWGNNQYNELGQRDDIVINRSSPVQVGTGSSWTKVSAGNNFSTAIDSTGTGYAWGRNDIGQVGSITPLSYTQVTTYGAIRNDGKLLTWGYNAFGKLGTNDTVTRSAPTQVSTLANASTSWIQVISAYNNTAGIKIDRKLYLWGDNTYGQLGVSDNITRSQAVQIGVSSWTQVYVTASNVYAIRSDNTLWSWGRNNLGQLGQGDTIDRSSPVQIGTNNWSMVVASGTHTLALRSDGTLYAWGYNQYNELGQNQRVQTNYSSPIQVGTSSFTTISAGANNSFAIRTDGALFGWGRTDYGQIGVRSDGTNINIPLSWTSVSGGDSYSVAIRSDGKLFSWGRNDKGQLGLGITINRSAPVQISVPTNYTYNSTFFNGSTDYLTITGGSTFNFGTGDFTMEAWAYATTISDAKAIFNLHSGVYEILLRYSGTTGWQLYYTAAGAVLLYTFNDTNSANNFWVHHAVVRISGVMYWYINGILVSSVANTTNYSDTTLVIGNYNIYYWSGYITNVRIVNGAGVYTQPFIVPIAPLPAIPGTVFLGLQNYYFIDNSTANSGSGFTVVPTTSTGFSFSSLIPFSYTTIFNYSWTQVSATLSHTVAIRNDGTLWAWGVNSSGQLGQGDTINRSTPVQIGASSWTSVFAGRNTTYAIRTDGALFTVGDNTYGQLGQNDNLNRSSIVQLGTSSWTTLSASQTGHVLGILSTGALYSWGNNNSGQLGNGALLAYRSSPVQIGTSSWTKVSAGNSHSIAIRTDSGLFTWGGNFSGQLGVPVTQGWLKVGAGIALRVDGKLFTWGGQFNGAGQNVANTAYKVSPTQLGTDTWISIGDKGGVAVRSDGTLWSWYQNINGGNVGQPGQNDTIDRSSPVQVGTDTDWRYAQSSRNSRFAIKADGRMYGWGDNTNGSIGDGTTISRSSPVQVPGSWTSVYAGTPLNVSNIAHGIKSDGTLWTWGYNGNGHLGDGTTIDKSSPVQISGGGSWSQVACDLGSLGLKIDGTLWSWGSNSSGQLGLTNINAAGDTINRSSPVQVGGSWTMIAVEQTASGGIKTDGTLWTWGQNFGSLGNSATTDRSSPVQVGASLWSMIGTKYYGFQGTLTTGVLYAWGDNSEYAIGNNSLVATSSPVAVTTTLTATTIPLYLSSPVQVGSSSWIQINAGSSWTGAIDSIYRLFTWGAGVNGEQGSGATASRSSPVQIPGTNSWTLISGNTHDLGIDITGRLFVWGSATQGQLGDNTTVAKSSPVLAGSLTGITFDNVSSPTQIGTSSWTVVNAGDYFTNAIRYGDGGLFTWGLNTSGQLGGAGAGATSGSTVNRSSPSQVGLSSWLNVASQGTSNTMAITIAYTIFGWGTNNNGQVGDNSIVNRSVPVQIGAVGAAYMDIMKSPTVIASGISWTQISAGDSHVAAIRSDTTLWGWGKNDVGQLGNGATAPRSSPVQIGAGTYSIVSAGYSTTAAIATAGGLQTTGLNSSGQQGVATTTNRSTIAVVGGSSWSQISAGSNSMIGVTVSNIVFTWGQNDKGQLGLNDTANRSSPAQLGSNLAGSMYQTVYPSPVLLSTGSATSWAQIGIGDSFSAGVDTAGRLYTWGYAAQGQLGDASTINTTPTKSSPSQIATTASSYTFINASSPVQVGTSSWSAIAAGGTHVNAIRSDGTLWGWGVNTYGQVGTLNTVTQLYPRQIDFNNSWTSIAAGNDFSAGITSTSRLLYRWGYYSSNEVAAPYRSAPVQIDNNTFSKVSIVNTTAFAITTGGALYGWGKITTDDNFYFNQIIATIPWASGIGYKDVNAGDSFVHAVKNDYTLWTTGANGFGQLGVNDTVTRSSAVQIGSGYSWTLLGGGFNPAIQAGSLFVTGNNATGQLGLTDLVSRSSPTQVSATNQPLFAYPNRLGISAWSNVSAGGSHSMAIRNDSTLWGWGYNLNGQIGDSTGVNKSSPVLVGTSSWIQVSAGKDHTAGIKLDNTLWSWGLNTRGQLGDGTTSDKQSPVQVGTGYWNSVNAGNSHTTALADNNTLYVWGDDSYGQ